MRNLDPLLNNQRETRSTNMLGTPSYTTRPDVPPVQPEVPTHAQHPPPPEEDVLPPPRPEPEIPTPPRLAHQEAESTVRRPPTRLGTRGGVLLALYFLGLITVNLMLLLEAVPIEITQEVNGEKIPIEGVNYRSPTGLVLSFLFELNKSNAQEQKIDVNTHLSLIVLFGGSLGGLIHGISSLQHHYRHRTAEQRYILWYIMRPFTGAALAMIVYFALRGGILTTTAVDILSPYGIATISIVVGLIEQRALMKIRDVVQAMLFGNTNTNNVDNT